MEMKEKTTPPIICATARSSSAADVHMQTQIHPPQTPNFDFTRSVASVKAKHGAIDKDCIFSSECMKMLNLYGILRMLYELNNKNLDKLDLSSIKPYYDMVEDAEKLKIDLKWLLKRLDEIKDAIISRDAVKVLTAGKNEHVQKRKEKLERHKGPEDEKMESMVILDDLIIDDLDRKISNLMPMFQHFQCRPLLDGLI